MEEAFPSATDARQGGGGEYGGGIEKLKEASRQVNSHTLPDLGSVHVCFPKADPENRPQTKGYTELSRQGGADAVKEASRNVRQAKSNILAIHY